MRRCAVAAKKFSTLQWNIHHHGATRASDKHAFGAALGDLIKGLQ